MSLSETTPPPALVQALNEHRPWVDDLTEVSCECGHWAAWDRTKGPWAEHVAAVVNQVMRDHYAALIEKRFADEKALEEQRASEPSRRAFHIGVVHGLEYALKAITGGEA